MFERVAVVGTGLIGGSIGLGLRKAFPGAQVTAFDSDPAAARAGLQRGAFTKISESAAAAAQHADVVVLSVPVDRIPALVTEVAAGIVAGDAVVTDVGSSKGEIVRVGQEALGGRFVGGHPMAGSERQGIEAADARLFHEAWWALTPTAETDADAYSAVTSIVRLLGAKPVAMDPGVHDSLVARLSHLPQLTASALVDVAAGAGDRDALLGLAAGGFRDVTRIAASHPEMWIAVLESNSEAILEALQGLSGRLESIADLIRREEWEAIASFLGRARRARLELFAKPDIAAEPVGLAMLVPDRPGVLAEVTTAAGRRGINIEDLRIVHSTEGGSGRLELVVAGKEPAEELVGVLTSLGYVVERTLD